MMVRTQIGNRWKFTKITMEWFHTTTHATILKRRPVHRRYFGNLAWSNRQNRILLFVIDAVFYGLYFCKTLHLNNYLVFFKSTLNRLSVFYWYNWSCLKTCLIGIINNENLVISKFQGQFKNYFILFDNYYQIEKRNF